MSHRRSMAAELACPQIVSSLSANLPLSGYGRFARHSFQTYKNRFLRDK
jgi:hypothetical protein